MNLPETEESRLVFKADGFILPVAQLCGLSVVAFILGTLQLLAVLYLTNGFVIYAVAAGLVVAAILVAGAFGVWRASWLVRAIAAFICVVVTSWPVVGMLLFAACYFGCRFW